MITVQNVSPHLAFYQSVNSLRNIGGKGEKERRLVVRRRELITYSDLLVSDPIPLPSFVFFDPLLEGATKRLIHL